MLWHLTQADLNLFKFYAAIFKETADIEVRQVIDFLVSKRSETPFVRLVR